MRRLVLAATVLATGCASYQPAPLADRDDLVPDVASLRVDASGMPAQALRSHPFDPRDGFDVDEVAMLAVANSPDLRALRATLGITRAQAFSAGLLPDPQLALSADRVLGTPPGSTLAWSAGLTFDVAAFLARSSARSAADAEERKSDLDLLWQEWQTVAQARLLFVKVVALEQSAALIAAQRAQLAQRLGQMHAAVARGLVTNDAATPLLTAAQDLAKQSNDLERQRNQARHDLNALLGVRPETQLVLVGAPDVPAPDAGTVRAAVANAPQRRPDLLALQAGFAAQDDRYRGALRAQFPAITIGPNRMRDTSNVNSAGPTLGISLPIFNRNRGNIAIESATREKLRVDYQQRLDAAVADADRLLAERAILERQRREIDAAIVDLARAASHAETAFAARNIDSLLLTNVEGALLAKRLEGVAVEQALREQAIALTALVGGDLDTSPHHRESSS
jgi:outer membrane protein TolC